jgi:hypothetical protein
MSSKIVASLVILVVLATALLIGNTLLTAAKTAQSAQVRTYPLSNPKACCQAQAKTHTQTSPAERVKSCCETNKQAGTCPELQDPQACIEKCPKNCCVKDEDAPTCSATDKTSCTTK